MSFRIIRAVKIRNRLIAFLIFTALAMLFPLYLFASNNYQNLLNYKKEQTQVLIDSAYSLVNHHFERFKQGEIDETTAKNAALSAIQSLRYDQSNYFWINDLTPNMVLHPLKPELNGQDLRNFRDKADNRLFVEMVTVAQQQGEGYVSYFWSKPNETQAVEKISYVKQFAPWGWILGTGIYIDDVSETFWNGILTLMIGIGLGTLVLCGFGIVIALSITRPSAETAHALENISGGEGDLTHELKESGKR